MTARQRNGDARQQWESAAPGWARWEPVIAAWMEPATDAMLAMAGIDDGARVLDVACGAGSQTLRAAREVGPRGHVVASDIAGTMLAHVRENAERAGLANVSTIEGAAEDLALDDGTFDACICHLGLMLFADPGSALRAIRHALRPGGKVAVVVFTTPAENAFMAEPMRILLRHVGRPPPEPGGPGIFALGAPGILEALLADAGFEAIEQRTLSLRLRLRSDEETLTMMREAFGAYRAVLRDADDDVRAAAWADVGAFLRTLRTGEGFEAPAEVLVAAAARPA